MQNLICKISGHRFSKWEYALPDRCEQQQECTRCHTPVEKRVLHELKWESMESCLCEQEQRCIRCLQVMDKRAEHRYIQAKDLRQSPCHIVEKCQICGKVKEEFKHDMKFVKRLEEYTTVDTVNWTDLVRCTVCGEEDKKFDWRYTDW